MTFDYNTLKRYAKNGDRLGNWNGKPVFATSAVKLDDLGSGAYYILYDDENKIVSRSAANGQWKSYGEVSAQGSVNEYGAPRTYRVPVESVEAMNPKSASYSTASYTPGYQVSERPEGDVKLTIDVEAMLKRAREMTIDDLLAGFDYGLDEAVG